MTADYRDDTDAWSECSVSDFAAYVNRQTTFCLESLDPSSTELTNQG